MSEKLDLEIGQVERRRRSIEDTQAQLDDTYRDYFGHYFATREKLFADLADGDLIQDGGIVDYAEASMRLDGMPARDASAKAEQLATVFAPSAGNKASPVYFYSGGMNNSGDGLLVVQPAAGSNDRLSFKLARDKNNEEVHDLLVDAEGTPNVFTKASFYLPSDRGGVDWTYGRQGTARVDFRKLKITDDPEEANWFVHEHPSILIGEAAVVATDPFGSYTPETIALEAILKEVEPEYWTGREQTGAAERTLEIVSAYAKRLLTTEDGDIKELRERMPVQFHPAVFPLHLDKVGVDLALLKGVAEAGRMLSEEEFDSILERVKNEKPRNIGETVDRAIQRRLQTLKQEADAVEVDSGLEIEPEELMQTALKHPDAYRELAYGGDHLFGSVVGDAVDAYMQRAPRFRGLGRAFTA